MKVFNRYSIIVLLVYIMLNGCSEDKVLHLTPSGALGIHITSTYKSALPTEFTAHVTVKGVGFESKKSIITAALENGSHKLAYPIEVPFNKALVVEIKAEINNVFWIGESNEITLQDGTTAVQVNIVLQPEGDPVDPGTGGAVIGETVQIGSQIWMMENLRTTKYNDGTDIPLITDPDEWGALTTPGYCWYNNDENNATYGALYNFYTINTGKLCPTGWHVPSAEEWATLLDHYGGEGIAGGELKEAGIEHWIDPNEGATNSSGFTALPGGRRNGSGIFEFMGTSGYWWSGTEGSSTTAQGRRMGNEYINVGRESGAKSMGFSVRCVKD